MVSTTALKIGVGSVQVFSVRSRVSAAPYGGATSALRCTDHVRVEAELALVTTDEQLAETADVALYVYGLGELRGGFQVEQAELGGTTSPTSARSTASSTRASGSCSVMARWPTR